MDKCAKTMLNCDIIISIERLENIRSSNRKNNENDTHITQSPKKMQ